MPNPDRNKGKKGGGPPKESAKDMNDLRRQEQAERGTGGQDTFGQAGGEKLRDKQQRGGQADNTRQ
jgi:hypothetical protein